MNCGWGRRWFSQSRLNLRSASLRRNVGSGRYAARARRRRCLPRRPGSRASVRSIAFRSKTRRTSASCRALASLCSLTTSARSTRVRATLVTGMPRTVERSSGWIRRERWTTMPGLGLRPRGTVTSNCGEEWSNPVASPAARWLRRAPGPQAITAAIRRESSVRATWPTANTPSCSRNSSLPSTRRRMASFVNPNRPSCRLETTPCCRLARAASASPRECGPRSASYARAGGPTLGSWRRSDDVCAPVRYEIQTRR